MTKETGIAKATQIAANQNQAVSEILRALGHEFSGSLTAQLDSCQINVRESDVDLATEYTHPSLPGVRVLVDW